MGSLLYFFVKSNNGIPAYMFKMNRMKNQIVVIVLFLSGLTGCIAQSDTTAGVGTNPNVKYNELTPQQQNVILNKATDRPFTGEYYQKTDAGLYICRQCNNPLYRSEDKFEAHCGWPSFDDEIEGAVTRVPDADGERVEIICNNCHGHLGHVFVGEGFTDKDTRHCVNTSSILFVPATEVKDLPAVIR
jgi:peptide-methionine (R)-S-oxide reductase